MTVTSISMPMTSIQSSEVSVWQAMEGQRGLPQGGDIFAEISWS